MEVIHFPLGGGVDGTSPVLSMAPGRLRIGRNIECKPGPDLRRTGYRLVEGFSKFDTTVVPGEGQIRGVHYYGAKVYAFRNASDGASCSMWSSTGSGWTEEKSGLTADGRYRLINYAFSGAQKMYGVSGAHKAFQWDGATWTDITTGMAADSPDHVIAHKKHLFLSFGNSVQNSSLGDPLSWTPLTGASEILLDDDITGFSAMPNGALGIYTKNGITLLSGSVLADFIATNTVEYGNNAGALADTIQPMGATIRFCDSRGITDMAASQASSDFYDSIISHDMDKTIEGRWTRATCATVVREKNQYRLFFNDGSGLIATFNNTQVGITQIQFPFPVQCVVNTEDATGNELIYFGSNDGYIYAMESGRSFAGAAIDAYAEIAFTDAGQSNLLKRWRRARFDVGRSGNAGLYVVPRYFMDGIGTDSQMTPVYTGSGETLGGAILNQVVLGGAPISEGDVDLEGISKWLSLRFLSSTTDVSPWEIDGVEIEFLPGRKRK